jgi:hypothetical protein
MLFEFINAKQKTYLPERIKKMTAIRERIEALQKT